MTTSSGAPGVPENIAAMMVAIGRMEEKLSSYRDLEDRIVSVELQTRSIMEAMPKKTPMPTIFASIAAIVAILIGLGTLTDRVTVGANAETIQELQTQITEQDKIIQQYKKELEP